MGKKFSDNARALLAGSINAAATSLTIEAAKADRFPVATTVDWLNPLDWFMAVLQDAAGNREVVKVGTRTAGSGVLGNLQRAQNGTVALNFTAGQTVVVHGPFAEDMENALAGVYPDGIDVTGLIEQDGVTGRITPVGGIIMWSGTVATIPAGWGLCDGTGGTPDLRNRFILGAQADNAGEAMAGITGAFTKTGGSKDSVLVSHSHTVGGTTNAAGSHVHTYNDPGHAHNYDKAINGSPKPASGGTTPFEAYQTATTTPSGTGITINANGDHSHTVSGSTNSVGESGANKNLPPYYVLAFIMCKATV